MGVVGKAATSQVKTPIEFEVEDVDQEFERLQAMNVEIVKPPTTQPWGRRSVWFRDPDGNIVNFYASVGLCCMKTGGAVLPLSRVIYAFLVIG